MSLTLLTTTQPARITLRGVTNVVIPDGRKLKIDVPSVEDIFNEGPPAGKQWLVNIDVMIEEVAS